MTSLLTSVLVALALACPSSQMAERSVVVERWTILGQTPAAEFSYDELGVERMANSTVRVRFRIGFRKDTPEGLEARRHMTSQTTAAFEGKSVDTVGHAVLTIEISCIRGLYRNRAQTLYSDSGSVIETVPGEDDPEWVAAPAGSANEDLIQRLCQTAEGQPSGDSRPSGAQSN